MTKLEKINHITKMTSLFAEQGLEEVNFVEGEDSVAFDYTDEEHNARYYGSFIESDVVSHEVNNQIITILN